MANKYLRSGAGGGATGVDWANAFLTLAAALTGSSAGDDIWVSEDHSELVASAQTYTSPGTITSPCRIICVNHAGSVPPVAADIATTAVVATSGANAMANGGYAYVYGITFKPGNSAAVNASFNWFNGVAGQWKFKNCPMIMPTGASAAFGIGNSNTCTLELIDSPIKFGATGQSINLNSGTFRWEGALSVADCSVAVPTTMFFAGAMKGSALIQGVDLSGAGSGKTLVGAMTSFGRMVFKDCKLGASVTKFATPTVSDTRVTFIRCNSGAVNYSYDIGDYYGALSIENTIILTGGASDGTNGFSHKIVTTTNAKWTNPFRSDPIQFWQEAVGSPVTVTLQGIWGGGAVPNNDDIWIEVEYLGSSGTPISTLISCTKANTLAANAALSAGAGTWGGSTTKFAMAVTFTPQTKGPVTVYVLAGAASQTFYVDPKPVVS